MILLTTKLHIPAPQSSHIARQRLIDRIEGGIQQGNRLTLLVAPAGFGKTTLLSTWLANRDQNRGQAGRTTFPTSKVAWLSLDANDQPLPRFLFYLINSLQPHLPALEQEVLNFVQAEQEPPVELILTTLLNAAAALGETVLLVLEDYHLASNAQTDAALAFLLEHISPNLHLVITSREDPVLPLSRLRVRGQLTELRAEDLRFSREEVAAFLTQASGLELSLPQIAMLEERTEGWIAGLQLAVLSLKGRQDTEHFITSFSGSHRYIMDYLVDEVLNLQSENLREFLLRTAILRRMNGELCNRLLDKQNGEQTLAWLENNNLFIVSLDSRREWYRYHHLFGELLLFRLNHLYRGEVTELHYRAGKWFAEHNFWDEAIYHITQSHKVEELESLLSAAIETFTRNNELNLAMPWFESIAEETIKQRPLLALHKSWVLALSGQSERSAEYAELARNLLYPESSRLEQGLLAAIQAYNARLLLDIPAALEHGYNALNLLAGQSPVIHNIVLMLLGQVKLLVPEFADEGTQLVREALTNAKRIGNRFGLFQSLSTIVFVLIAQARTREASLLLDQYEKEAETSGPYKIGSSNLYWLPALRGTIYYLTNDLKKAQEEIGRIIKDEQSGGFEWQSKTWAYMIQAMIYQAEGNLAKALDIFQRIEAAGVVLPPTIGVVPFKVTLLLQMGELEEASQWVKAEGLTPIDAVSPYNEDYYLCYARILTAQRRYDEALTVLRNLEDLESSLGNHYRLAIAQILQAIIYKKLQQPSLAKDFLTKAILLVSGPKLYRTFLDEDPLIFDLLVELKPVAPEFMSNLLGMYHRPEPKKVEDSQIISPLSQREQEILDLMSKGLSNREIGERLILATGTVKRHAANIFEKLEVNSRTGAIARARELGLF